MSKREIAKGTKAFSDAASAQDLDAIANLYTVDATVLAPDSEVVKGRDAIRQLWKAAIAAGLSGAKIESVSVQVIGNLAIDIGHAALSMTPAGGSTSTDLVKYTVIWKKVRGQWRIHLDMWNSRTPA